MNHKMPVLFVSHGAPSLAVETSPAASFLDGLSATLPSPSAVLCISAHWRAKRPTLGSGPNPATVHDFRGFPEVDGLSYPAPGAPALAEEVVSLLGGPTVAGLDPERGFDHGVWTPLMRIWPAADVPVVQLSLIDGDATDHYELGRRLAPLRERGVLILASGSATHDLASINTMPADGPPASYAVRFADWLQATIEAGDNDALCNYLSVAPDARSNHPTDEHLLPLHVAAGAAQETPGRAVYRGYPYPVFAADSYLWS